MARKNKTLVDWDWQPTPKTVEWIRTNHPHIDVQEFVEMFIDQCNAIGYKYVNHDSALKNWVRRNPAPKQSDRTPAQKLFVNNQPEKRAKLDTVNDNVLAMKKALGRK